jgi:bifunctional DNA-binding transcriptional regulator/antitoxin component of YhaV-PrlF toxin-antitoxin module
VNFGDTTTMALAFVPTCGRIGADGREFSIDVGAPMITTKRGSMMDRAVKIDAQGRVAIPAAMRASLGLQPRDTLFAHLHEETGGVRLTKAINPFDVLFDHAVAEYRAGRTMNLRDFAAGVGVALDGPDE